MACDAFRSAVRDTSSVPAIPAPAAHPVFSSSSFLFLGLSLAALLAAGWIVSMRICQRKGLLRLVENLPGMVFVMERNGAVSFVNRLGRASFEAIPKEALAHLAHKEVDLLSEWTPGNGRTYRLSSYPFQPDTPRKATLFLALDITELKETAELLHQSKLQYRELADHLQEQIEKEKKVLAMEIHDELGQLLTTIVYEAGWASLMIPDHMADAQTKIRSVNDLLKQAINGVRRLCEDLRPSLLDNFGLVSALKWGIDSFSKRTHLECRLNIDDEHIPIQSKEKSIAIYRFIQEFMTNTARHAQASRIDIDIRRKGSTLELDLRDNGIGVGKEQVENPRSFGIFGMKERIESLGGAFSITGIPGKGTFVTASVPLDGDEESDEESDKVTE